MQMEIRPLGPALGAEIFGLDFSRRLDDAVVAGMEEAFLEHHLLCLRSDPLEAPQFARVAGYFGEPQLQLLRHRRHADAPEVSMLESTYRRPEDKPDDLRRVRLSGWHTDDSYFEVPAMATMLQALDIPSHGGQTRFCNTRKAYEALSDETKARLEGLRAMHGYDTARAVARAEERTEVEAKETPDVVHPLVRTLDESGRRAIYYNSNRTDHVVGMQRSDSDALLDMLHRQITQPQFQYHHEWRVGDILVWDNRCLVHSVNTDFPVGEPRRHQRILLKGSKPV